MGTGNLELLLFAIQHGALNDRQIEDCLHEWEASGEAIDPLRTIALNKGYLTEQRIHELADGRKKSGGGDSAVRVDVLMDCRECGAERVLSLDSALRNPVCPRCAVPLTFQKKAERPAVKSYLLPFPAEVHQALEDPKNRFGRYVLLSKLGAGGMGEVFKAWDTLLARAVALKFPRTMGEEEIHRLHIEAQGAGGLSHPNIASVYEIAEVEGRTCIAMQFIEGRTAADKALERPGAREIVRWMGDAARGAHYAHERGVIHRDIKPMNLMIDTEGRVYVMDFGLAKLSASPGGATISGMVLGTPAFMSPEQASGSAGQVDRRSDVYSLGATLYVLLCGQTPYTGETSSDILIQILTTDPPALRQRDPSIPWELEAIASRAMARDREQRYDTALAMADDLDRWLANEPIHARRSTLLYRAGKKLHRHRGLLLAGAACLALAVIPFFLFRSDPDRFRGMVPPPQRPPGSALGRRIPAPNGSPVAVAGGSGIPRAEGRCDFPHRGGVPGSDPLSRSPPARPVDRGAPPRGTSPGVAPVREEAFHGGRPDRELPGDLFARDPDLPVRGDRRPFRRRPRAAGAVDTAPAPEHGDPGRKGGVVPSSIRDPHGGTLLPEEWG
jgi:hypothetical protein